MVQITKTENTKYSSISAQDGGAYNVNVQVRARVENLPPGQRFDEAVFEAVLPGGTRLPMKLSGQVPNADGSITASLCANKTFNDVSFYTALATTNGADVMDVVIKGALDLVNATVLFDSKVQVPVNRVVPPPQSRPLILSPSSLNA